jgi:hypothetical protein
VHLTSLAGAEFPLHSLSATDVRKYWTYVTFRKKITADSQTASQLGLTHVKPDRSGH